jgi:predicted ATPase/DNA-binding CsgD family transcriptional regulator
MKAAKPGRHFAGSTIPNNLPRYLTNFVQREGELAAIKAMLGRSRMVTLTGPGGAGKSRLASEVASSSLGVWPDGVWWVELAPLNDPGQVAGAVVAAMALPGRGSGRDVVAAFLADRRALLVLDNCEHLVAACAEFCQRVLERCPELTIVATSREALGVSGEAHWPVASLPATEAVRLFEARAVLVRPTFKVASTNLEAVTEICERVDRLPLAIELAAARLGMMTEHEILSQLSNRFRLLTGGARTAPERQQTMTATIDWSFRLLSHEEAQLFTRLAVFRGGFTLESAQAICAEATESMLGVLSGLVQKSMVVAEVAAGSGTRYRLLESQLAYAEDRLRDSGDLGAIRSRHYEYFRKKSDSREISAAPSSISRAEWKKWESANLWAAAAWARNHVEDLGLSLVVEMNIADFNQSRAVIDNLLAHYPIQGIVRARGLETAAFIAWVQGDHQVALQLAESSVALARGVGDVEQVADSLNVLGMALQGSGELAAAGSAYDEAIALLSDSGNRAMMATIKNSVGILAVQRGDFAAAADTLAGVVATGRAEGDPWATLSYLDSLAWAQLGLGDHPAASASWRESLSIASRLTDPFGVLVCLQGLSCVASRVHDDQRALRLAAAAEQMASAESLGTDSWMLRQLKESQLQSRARLGTRKSGEAWNQGLAMVAEQAVAYALEGIEPESATDAGPLSRREQEVVRLVAAGMTNRQIGERLFITERSAEGHLERIRNKLRLRSRTELATWAVGHGLSNDPGTPGEEDPGGSPPTGKPNDQGR